MSSPSTKLSNVTLPKAMVRMEGLGIRTVPMELLPSDSGGFLTVNLVMLKPVKRLRPGISKGQPPLSDNAFDLKRVEIDVKKRSDKNS